MSLLITLSRQFRRCNNISQKERRKVTKALTRPAWAGFKTAEEGIAIIMSYIL
jgi:hypothetical protein